MSCHTCHQNLFTLISQNFLDLLSKYLDIDILNKSLLWNIWPGSVHICQRLRFYSSPDQVPQTKAPLSAGFHPWRLHPFSNQTQFCSSASGYSSRTTMMLWS